MCIRDRGVAVVDRSGRIENANATFGELIDLPLDQLIDRSAVSYTHLRAHETVLDLVCRLLLEKKKKDHKQLV